MHDLISNVYAAVAGDCDQGWQDVAADLADRLDARSVVIDDGAISGSAHQLLVNHGFETDLVQRHFQEFPDIESNIGVQSLFSGPVGTAFDIHCGIDRDVWHRDRSVAGILTPQGITDGSLLVMERSKERLSSLLVYRSDRAGPLHAREVAFLEAFGPHLSSATRLRRRLVEMAQRERQSHLLLAEISEGLVVTDGLGRIRSATGAAARALAEETSVYCSHGRLRAKDREADRVLRHRFHTAGNPTLRIPTKPAMHSKMKPATCSDFIPAAVPI
ncbi:hypothetical protein VQ042_21890 [Aurantimonas sp. A2-1-M11]|uniref:hypothetical protein n=1 Tax=Aurantimonas sp. A2-1-M11 TaxID=3113712 RepID=UPI002F94C554